MGKVLERDKLNRPTLVQKNDGSIHKVLTYTDDGKPDDLEEVTASPAATKPPATPQKSEGAQVADWLRPAPDPEHPTRTALGATAADLTGGVVNFGRNVVDLPANLASIAKRAATGEGLEVGREAWQMVKENPMTVISGLLPGAGSVAAGAVGQAIDQEVSQPDRGDPADQYGNILSSAVLNALPAMIKQVKVAAPTAAAATRRGLSTVTAKLGETAEKVAPQQVAQVRAATTAAKEVRQAMRNQPPPRVEAPPAAEPPPKAPEAPPAAEAPPGAAPGPEAPPTAEAPPTGGRVGKVIEDATGLPASVVLDEVKAQVRNPLTPKNMLKQGLSRASGVPVDAIEEIVRNPDVMQAYIHKPAEVWKELADDAQGRLKKLPKLEGDIFNETISHAQVEGKAIVPDSTRIAKVDGEPVSQRVPGTKVDNTAARMAFDQELINLGVIDHLGYPTMGNPSTAALLKVTEGDARALLRLRERIRGANSWDSTKAAMDALKNEVEYSADGVPAIGSQSERAVKMARKAMADTLEAMDETGSVAAANKRYSEFRKFYDEAQKRTLGKVNLADDLRNMKKGPLTARKIQLTNDLRKLHGLEPLSVDPNLKLTPTGIDPIKEIDLTTKGQYFNPELAENVTSTGRDMAATGTLALSQIIPGILTGNPGMVASGIGTGLLWHNTRPAQLGATLSKMGRTRNALRAAAVKATKEAGQ